MTDTKEAEATLIKREFKTVCEKSREESFRVFQWNVLADGLTESSTTSNFCAVPLKYLEWKYRSKLMLAQIICENPDVICLQEVDHFEDFLQPELLKYGYTGVFMPKINSPCLKFANNNGPDGVAIFYRTSRYVANRCIKNYLKEEDNKTGQAGLLTFILEDKILNKSFILTTVHLKAKTEFAHRRLAQTQHALQLLHDIVMDSNNLPVVWCGDFNGQSDEPFHEKIITSNLSLESGYTALGEEIRFSTWKIRPDGECSKSIDYVWFSKTDLKVCNVLLPMEDDLMPETRFPSFNHASDHIALCLDFCFA